MIKVVEITRIEAHPESGYLQVCQVFDGQDRAQVVCGAKNLRVAMKSIWAQVGDQLPGKEPLQVAVLRGVESFGMLCSAKDLALVAETGIIDLPQETVVGVSAQSLAPELLSSIAWHTYREVDAFYWDQSARILVVRPGEEVPRADQFSLIARTYFHCGRYYYRNLVKMH